MECPACSFENNDDSQFCSQCGFPLYIDESELPDDIHLPASSWDGMERSVPYVIAGLRTGQLPSSLGEGEAREDGPKKLETVFYADYAEAFDITADAEDSNEAAGEREADGVDAGELEAGQEQVEGQIAEGASEEAESEGALADEGRALVGDDEAARAVGAEGACEVGSSDGDVICSGDDMADASVEGDEMAPEPNGGDDVADVDVRDDAAGSELGADAADAMTDHEASAGGDAKGESASAADGDDENGERITCDTAGADTVDDDETADAESENGVSGDGEDTKSSDDADNAGDDDSDDNADDDDDDYVPRGKHARIVPLAGGQSASECVGGEEPAADGAESSADFAGDERDLEAPIAEGEGDAPGGAAEDDALGMTGVHAVQDAADGAVPGADGADTDTREAEGAAGDDTALPQSVAEWDGQGEPPWPEEYQPSADSLQDLPDITSEDYTRVQSPNQTAVMPVITRRDAVRYSTSDRDRLDARRKRAPIIPMLIALLLAVLGIFGIVSLSGHGVGGTEVPDVVGMSSDSARNTLLEAGFQVNVRSQLTEDNYGIVLSCDPEAGAKKKKGTHVTITVSASRTIPDVVGLDIEAAQNRLADEGAENVQVESKASNQPENTVIDISPAAGQPFNPEDEIVLTVATSAKVPGVVGMRQEEAMAALSEAGYVPEVKWADSDADAGVVLSTNPEAGANANLNSTVTVFVASPGPRDIYHLFDYYDAMPSADSEYLQWKGFTIAGSYTYDGGGMTYASQMWQQPDGSTISFTQVPYTVDMGMSYEDYLAQGIGFQGVRLYIPAHSALSLGTDVSEAGVQAYMDACGFDNKKDFCTNEDVKSEGGASGKELGLPKLACAQGEMNGYVWTVLVTESATYIGCGPRECYDDLKPICDGVVVNEMYAS